MDHQWGQAHTARLVARERTKLVPARKVGSIVMSAFEVGANIDIMSSFSYIRLKTPVAREVEDH